MNEQHDHPLDPRLQEKLALLRPTPPRDLKAIARGRERFLSELDSMPEFKASPRFAWLTRWFKSNQISKEDNPVSNGTKRLAFSALMAAIVILVFLFGGVSATALAAQSALPGDALYPVKTGLEQTRVALARDAYSEAQLYLQFAQRRLDEINALIQEGRFDDIATAAQEFEAYTNKAIAALQVVMAGDPDRAAMLSQQVSAALVGYAQALKGVWVSVPETVKPAVEKAISASQNNEGFPLSGDDNANDNANDNGHENGFGNDNANDNGNDNGNDNANDNENGNDNGNANDNGNGNDNANDNGNDNANDNGNDNGNDNSNDNDDDNGNDNANDNGNDNANDNGNDNGDDNGKDNANDNGNDNGNDNANDNENGNDNANDNGDDNGNDNGDDTGNDNSLILTPPILAS